MAWGDGDMCQGCVDDGKLSQATFDRMEAFLEDYPQAAFGPAHIVLDDNNIEDVHLDYHRPRKTPPFRAEI